MVDEVEMFPEVERCPCYKWDTNELCRWHEPEAWRERYLSQLAHASQEGTS